MSRDAECVVHSNFLSTINGKPYLTPKGIKAFNDETKKWDIIRTYCFMHEYSPSAYNLDCGDYFSGPRFKGNGLQPNIFKFTIHGWSCKFEPVPYNESNMKKVRKDIKINDFAWFKVPTGICINILLMSLITF